MRQVSAPEGEGLDWLREAKRIWYEFSLVSTATHASSIAYYAFLSLVPLLALCISLISFTGISQLDVYTFLTALVPDALSDFVNALVSDAFDRSGLAFSLSTLSLLWSASKGAKAMRVGLNAAYREREERNAVVVAVISIVAVIVMGVLLAATMWLIFGDSLLHTFARHIPSLLNHHTITAFTNIAITVVAGVFALALCYTFLPAGNRRFAAQLPGAAFALVGCGALSLGFRLYVDQFGNYTVLYGSLATVALLLFWMYLLFYILIAGVFLNHRLAQRQPSSRRDITG